MIYFVLLLALLTSSNAFALFTKVADVESARVVRVAISRRAPEFMAVASRNALYVSKDHGSHFQRITGVKDESVVHLVVDDAFSPTVYLAGERQCFEIGEVARKIFSAKDDERIYSVAKHQGRVYVATSDGLYYADESLLDWRIVPGLRGSEVYSVEGSGDSIYLACDTGVYCLRVDGSLRRLFATRGDEESSALRPQLLKVDLHVPGRLWLCTNKGLFCSTDLGETWQKFYVSGASAVSISCFAQYAGNRDDFYICTDVGLFCVEIKTGDSRPIFEGISSSETWWLDFTEAGEIYLATAQGLLTDKRFEDRPAPELVAEPGLSEPPIEQIQDAALRYNSIHPDKVNRWRRRLKYRALFPKLSVDYDKTIGSSFTKDQHYFAEGPNDWGVSLTWDIGDLIWNTYEDDIDNRNKLTTQLRIDVLDEINRIYFERLRLQQEIAGTSAADSASLPLKKLRLRELTATLDGYTGGFLSRNRVSGDAR